ncbi:MAG: hypothetical protein B7X55_00475 [Rhodobacterales bacterium 34-62-10]|nr:MAG: hypothetical protein B7X55_00475 [Rhodobacterales bacterium 34-62-10]
MGLGRMWKGNAIMISQYAWYLRDLLKKVWVRVASFAVFALLSVWLARVLSPFLTADIALKTGSDAAEELLTILTTSMLAVTTFSLSIAVSAFAAAASTATPRAVVLLQEDRTTQNVLATFLGAFLFGLVGLIALNADLYDDAGLVVIFGFTVVVIGLVVVALIRWIDHLMSFGRMRDTLDRVEAATTRALDLRLNDPYFGGHRLVGLPDDVMIPVPSRETGYVQHIDMPTIQDCAKTLEAQVYLNALPGRFVVKGAPLMWVSTRKLDDQRRDRFCAAVTLGTSRTFEGDPRFGLIVLSEIASRALSPAVNDPGTAIDILGRLVRILSLWQDRAVPNVRYDAVHVPAVTPQEAVEDAFRPISRDGASIVELQIRLQKSLRALSALSPTAFAVPATRMAEDAVARAEAAGIACFDLAEIRAVAGLSGDVVHPDARPLSERNARPSEYI